MSKTCIFPSSKRECPKYVWLIVSEGPQQAQRMALEQCIYQQQQQKQISQRLSLVARFSLVSFSVNKILEFDESIVSTAQSTATPYHSTLDVKRNENVMLLMKAPKKKLNDTYRQLQ